MKSMNLAEDASRLGERMKKAFLEAGGELLSNSVLYNIYMMTKVANDFGWYD